MISTDGLRRLREGIRRGAAHPSVSWLADHDDGTAGSVPGRATGPGAPAEGDPDGSGRARRPHAAPWSATAARELRLVAAGQPFLFPFLLLVTTPKLWVAISCALPLLLPPLTRAQRSRFRALGRLAIPAHPPAAQGTPLVFRLLAWVGSEATWRQLGYHLLIGPLLALTGLLSLLALGAGGALATTFLWRVLIPRGTLLRVDFPIDLLLTALGAALLLAGPWLAVRVARVDRRAARGLLGPSRARELERRVEDLTESRAGVLDAADAERRRIERDLHDGAQQRLVSLAMNLGLARKTLKDVSPEAMRVIVEAHEEAQAAIAELRNLVRGLHPVVLEDRGLDAALSGVAARAPLPVRLEVDLPRRVAPTVEAVAYFVVSEALANVAKHARASRVDLSVRQLGPQLRIVIRDDGIGGADPSRGTGLIGLRKRAASVDGTLSISSPVGGPTVIVVELPCEL
ncbi:sensor histidine kinase [Kitasatospora sp. LaBMicrA B282]|uniref:sensor histidine kinase n=1 Tax=Kitasatospora sp. LaBMicrA B282 TaxID=3420949 RepID=UPI003D13F756